MIPYITAQDMGDLFSKVLLESKLRGVPPERLLARLQSERDLALANTDRDRLVAIALVERTPDNALRDTLMSLAMQSAPVSCFLVVTDGVDRAWTESWAKQLSLRPDETIVVSEEEFDAARRGLADGYITILRHGDCLHPSAAAWTGIHASQERVDVLTWGEIQPDGSGGIDWAQRNPALEPITLMHLPYLRNACAINTKYAAHYPGDLIRESRRNDLHLFQLWLLRQKLEWRNHPEFFLVRSSARREEKLETSANRAFVDYAATYEQAFNGPLGEWDLRAEPNGAAVPYTLHPKCPVPTLSVIIPFRDKAELTWRSVESVARQDYAGDLEIVLINNQSRPEELASLRAFLAGTPNLRWRILDYDKPFNHSAQCNLGIQHSAGEIIVLMNNDTQLVSPNLLEEIASWANVPKIATVGVAARNESTGIISAGMSARTKPTTRNESPFEERSHPVLTPFTREVPGNTFALAAISRHAFRQVGQLDAARFPNGYNDVEFCCRASAQGFAHVVLGGLMVTHTPGQSRGRSDENAQKLLIRHLYSGAGAGNAWLTFDESVATIQARSSSVVSGAKTTIASSGGIKKSIRESRTLRRLLALPFARQIANFLRTKP